MKNDANLLSDDEPLAEFQEKECVAPEKKTTLKIKGKAWEMVKIYLLMTNHCQKLQKKKGFTKRRVKKIVYIEVGDVLVKFGLLVKKLIAKFCCVLNILYTLTRENHGKKLKPKRLQWKEDRNRTWLKYGKNSC